jgi:histidine triad (HIT) family protein
VSPSSARSCIFCKIAAGEIPAKVVKRADGMLAFTDVSPQAPTHLLVIPTTHVSSLNDAKDAASLGKLLGFARDVAKEAGIDQKGYRVVVNTNPDGGQTVFHLHLHVLGGRPMHWPPG